MKPTPTSRRIQPNHLGGETSPYLLQHAWNPVDWYPWGTEALELARSQQKPIFLSIGYSACHWCHVMEHESFENEQIAALMNQHFVNIKVDREERPDLDQIYMTAVQLMTGRGGWPMSVFLTPELKPFYGGTYWPPVASRGMPGFGDILSGVQDAWVERPDEVESSAERLTAAIRNDSRTAIPPAPLSVELLKKATAYLYERADRRLGGFGAAPKFPHSMDLRVLLRAWKRFRHEEALSIVTLALDQMSQGGIYDHLGGGFHRYSTDDRWLVPHFEKMLYDNALLVPVYLEAWQATGNEQYVRIVRETLEYVLREMTHPQGGFYSAQDADSEGVEGKYFIWSEAEVLQILGPEVGPVFADHYDITQQGNWEGSNILNRSVSSARLTKSSPISEQDLDVILSAARGKLLAARSKRVSPGRDEKVLTSWNGMMIAAMAEAAQVLQEERYLQGARRAADFLLGVLQSSPGRLWHTHKDGQSKLNAYADDYACAIDGLVNVFQATQEIRYLDAALSLADTLRNQFEDPLEGGFFFTSHDHESLLVRQKESQDNATPSSNSMAAYALLKLARLADRPDLEQVAIKTLETLAPFAHSYPSASGQALLALDFYLGPAFEIVLVEGQPESKDLPVLLTSIHQQFVPNKVLVIKRQFMGEAATDHPLKLARGKPARGSVTTAYVCQQGTCGMPQTTVDGLLKALSR